MIWVDPDSEFLPIPDPGSSSQKGTGSRIRSTVFLIFCTFYHIFFTNSWHFHEFFFFLSASDASFVDREFCFSTPNSKSSVRSQLENAADKLSYSEDEDDQPAAFTSVVASPLGRMHVSDLPKTANTSGHDLSDYREDVTEHPGVTPDDQFSPSAEARGDHFSNFHDKMSTGNGR
jgi:hypothetical protein